MTADKIAAAKALLAKHTFTRSAALLADDLRAALAHIEDQAAQVEQSDKRLRFVLDELLEAKQSIERVRALVDLARAKSAGTITAGELLRALDGEDAK